MRCFYCNKNEAVKSYERVEKGGTERAYYCLACYERLFLCVKEAESERSLSVCPYCGTALEEFHARKIVGCAYCYKTMRAGIVPAIVKMQGQNCGHRGRKPLLSEEGEMILGRESFATEEERDNLRLEIVKAERFARQKGELEALIKYLGGANPEREREYKDKLERMVKTGEVEEEIVW